MPHQKKTFYVHSSIIGIHVLDDEFKLVKELELKDSGQCSDARSGGNTDRVTGTAGSNAGKTADMISKGEWIAEEKELMEDLCSNTLTEKVFFVGYKRDAKDFLNSNSNNSRKCFFLLKDKEDKNDNKNNKIQAVLSYFKSPVYFERFRNQNIALTKAGIRSSIGRDDQIIQALNSVDETSIVINSLSKRLREWYALHAPEFVKSCGDNKELAEGILSRKKQDLLLSIGMDDCKSMGADFDAEEIAAVRLLASEVISICKYREKQAEYIDRIMQEVCPNLRAVASPLLGARLLSLAGSLQKLAEMPSSTIQLLGAEKALFRHIKTGAKCPKYGVIHEHLLISRIRKEQHGKAARTLADKISLAVKIDYFKGSFIGSKLVEDLEKRFLKK